MVDLLAASGLKLSSYSDSPTSSKVTHVRLIFWLTDSMGIFTGLSIETDALQLLQLDYVLQGMHVRTSDFLAH